MTNLETNSTPSFFSVYVRTGILSGVNHALILKDTPFTFDQRLASEGWKLVWDSAPTEFAGGKYAFDGYCAVPVQLNEVLTNDEETGIKTCPECFNIGCDCGEEEL